MEVYGKIVMYGRLVKVGREAAVVGLKVAFTGAASANHHNSNAVYLVAWRNSNRIPSECP